MDVSRRGFIKSALAFTAATALPIPKSEAKPIKPGGPGPEEAIEVQLPKGWTGSNIKIRDAEVAYSADGKYISWHRTRFSALRKGDIFRVREPDGTLVDHGTHLEVCRAEGDAFPESLGGGNWTWGVKVEPCDLENLNGTVREALKEKHTNLFVDNPSPYANPEVTYG